MKSKRNGLDRPYHLCQFVSCTIIVLNSISLYIFYIPVTSQVLQIISGTLYTISLILVLIWGYKLTTVDPTDTVDPNLEGNKFCGMCQKWVHSSSKHCMKCYRCVVRFDHHCKWVNNCVGEVNYHIFIKVVCSLFFMFLFIFSLGLFLIVEAQNDYSQFEENISDLYSGGAAFIFGVIITITLESFVFFILITYLIILHICLRIKGITTFEYIISRNTVAPDLKRDKNKTKKTRDVEVNEEVKEDLSPSEVNVHQWI